jgi:Spy/CpxP family protein refolding chaperone
MKKLSVVLLILVIASLSLTDAFGQPRKNRIGMGPGIGPGWGFDKTPLIERLNLTDAQKDKIAELRTKHQTKMVDLRADLQKSQIALRELKGSKDYNRKNVTAAVEKVNKIKAEIALTAANHRMDVYEILTDEQKEIWRDQPFGFGRKGGRCDFGFGQGYGRGFRGGW